MTVTKEARHEYYLKNREEILKKNKISREKHLDRRREDCRRWRKDNPEKSVRAQRVGKLRMKARVLERYGKACACCGENDIRFLTIDHKNNDGAQHRARYGLTRSAGGTMYHFLIRNGFPLDVELQTLCFNCNCSKSRATRVGDRRCPHTKGLLTVDDILIDKYERRGKKIPDKLIELI